MTDRHTHTHTPSHTHTHIYICIYINIYIERGKREVKEERARQTGIYASLVKGILVYAQRLISDKV